MTTVVHPGDSLSGRQRAVYVLILGALTALGPFTIDLYLPAFPQIEGDLDVSTITELPKERRPVTTRWMRESQREEVYAAIREQLAQGRQGYVVYPLVEDSAVNAHPKGVGVKERRAATQMAKQLQADVFPDVRVGLLHGQMKPRTKEQTMQAFVRGEIRLLVSTVIVEVGLDVPSATVMVIEHPERFGLAQLHQLRGRIGRGVHPATCFLISDPADGMVRQRLTAFGQGFRRSLALIGRPSSGNGFHDNLR